MPDNTTKSCCGCGSSCCEPQQEKKRVVIDFLYLDLIVCTRCQGAESSLDDALMEVAKVLETTGTEVKVNKININTKQLAEEYKFLSSPTIRVNGKDIAMEVRETLCQECGDLCGSETECRSWIYEGVEYSEPPKAMIIEAVLKEVFGGGDKSEQVKPYVLPKNLETFFAGITPKKI
jgi:hypothetical protein